MAINAFDIIILVVILFYAFEGFEIGFVAGIADLVSFVASFIIALKMYALVGTLVATNFGIPVGFAYAGAFFTVAILAEFLLGVVLRKGISNHYASFARNAENTMRKTTDPRVTSASIISLNKLLGIVPGVLSACIILAFFLTVIVALPFSPVLKNSVSSSRLGATLIAGTQQFEGSLQSVFGQSISDTLNFITVKPDSNDTIALNFKTTAVIPDSEAESAMFELLNKERAAKGLDPLVFDTKLRDAGRDHAKDMFARGYFSHFTPEGLSPFDRMARANISFSVAGENLALAPTTSLAMQGLMNSKGHRDNMLSDTYKKVGIGAIDGGIYGTLFTQEFSD